MKRTAFLLTATVVLVSVGMHPVFAQHGNRPSSRPRPQMGPRPTMSSAPARSSHRTQTGRAEHDRKTVSELLQQNRKLSSRLDGLLPVGTNLQAAGQGFKNLGEFVSAAHVSRILGIPFDQLKAKVTGPNAVSLGQAIKDLKSGVDAGAEAKKAKKQAKKDLKESNS